MKKLYFCFMFIIFCFGCSRENSIIVNVPGGPENFNNIQDAVVVLVKKDENENIEIPNCTGFFISETDIITAAHCVLKYVEVAILTADGIEENIIFEDVTEPINRKIHFITRQQYLLWNKSYGTKQNPEYYTTTIISVLDPKKEDLALLRIVDTNFKSENYLKLRNWNKTKPVIGEDVFVVGNPGGNPWVLTKGILSKIMLDSINNAFVLHDAKIAEGSSGSPLLDVNGDVVAINNKYLGDNNFLSVAIPSTLIERLYK